MTHFQKSSDDLNGLQKLRSWNAGDHSHVRFRPEADIYFQAPSKQMLISALPESCWIGMIQSSD
jgi:hypothetical protein